MGEMDAAGAWHADEEVLAAYRDGRLDVAGRWSVEAHLTSCAACRLQAGALVDPARLRRLRAALIEAVDVPRAGVVERLLVRLGVPDHTARVLAATPALRGSWLLAAGRDAGVRGAGRLGPPRRGRRPVVPLRRAAAAAGRNRGGLRARDRPHLRDRPCRSAAQLPPAAAARRLRSWGPRPCWPQRRASCCPGSAGARPAGCCPRWG